MSEYQNKLEEAFGKSGDLEEALKQGIKEGETPGPGEAPKQEPVKPEQQEEEAVETQEPEVKEPETTEPPEQTEEEKVEEEKKAERHRDTKAEARIAELIKERNQVREDRARLKGQLEAIRQAKQQAEPGISQVDPDAPNPANYPKGEDDIDFKVDLKFYRREQLQKQTAFRIEQREMLKKYPDMQELLDMDKERVGNGIQTANPTVFKLLQESEVKGELWHYLLANSDEAIRIAAMDPIMTAREIGKIESKLAVPELVPETKPKKPLPPPINPVKPTKPNSTAGVKNFGFSEY